MNTLAKVKPNQLVQNGNFTSISGWNVYSGTGSVANNTLSVTGAVGRNGSKFTSEQYFNTIVNHTYYFSVTYTCECVDTTSTLTIRPFGVIKSYYFDAISTPTKFSAIYTIPSSATSSQLASIMDTFPYVTGVTMNYTLSNIMVIDLTELYGAGNEPSTVAEFEADFPADYYEYNTTTERKLILSADGKAITL